MWFVLQSLIIFAVIASNIHWHWTPNGYVAGLIGVCLAYVVTCTVILVTQKVAERISTDEIRSILNALVKKKELQSNRGAGPHQTTYMAPPQAADEAAVLDRFKDFWR